MAARILPGALVAGLLAGFVAALLNLWTLTPLILEAEGFEAPHAHADGVEHVHEAQAPGLSRALGTVATTLVAYAGFGLLLGVGLAVAREIGDRETGLPQEEREDRPLRQCHTEIAQGTGQAQHRRCPEQAEGLGHVLLV